MKHVLMISVLVFVVAVSGFAKQPAVVEAKIEPAVASAGDKVLFTVEFTGKTADIQSVEIFVREYPYDAPEMILAPKPESKKNVWELVGQVPYESPVQKYNLEIKAIDKDGKEIVTESCKEQNLGKAGKLEFEVK